VEWSVAERAGGAGNWVFDGIAEVGQLDFISILTIGSYFTVGAVFFLERFLWAW
jgi:hypothetical protein